MAQLVDGLPHGTLQVVEGRGHAVWVDDLEESAQIARRFLGGAEQPVTTV